MSALPYWIYRGRTTTPINIPGKGPIVLVPRQKFYAPAASVSHLVKIKLVVRLRDPEPVEKKNESIEGVESDHKSREEVDLGKPKSDKEQSETETKAEKDGFEPKFQDVVVASETYPLVEAEGIEDASSEEPTEEEGGTSSRGRRKKKGGVNG